MPESISSRVPNMCVAEAAEVASSAISMAPPRAAHASTSPPADPAPTPSVTKLVTAHDARQCTGERVALAVAATRAAISLVRVVVSAPTEVGLAYTVGGFVLDSVTLAAAAANFVDCERAKDPKARGG